MILEPTPTPLPVEYIAGLPGPRLVKTNVGETKIQKMVQGKIKHKKMKQLGGYRCDGYGNGATKK